MAVNKDELKELIENNLFGSGDFSFGDLNGSEDTSEGIQESLDNDFLLTQESEDISLTELDLDIDLPETIDTKDTTESSFATDINLDMQEEFEEALKFDSDDNVSSGISEEFRNNQNLLMDLDLSLDNFEQIEDKNETMGENTFDHLDINFDLDNYKEEVEKEPEPEERKQIFPDIMEPEILEQDIMEPDILEPEVPKFNYNFEEKINVKPIEFPQLEEQISGRNFDLDFFANIPVKVDIFLGNTTISLKEIYDLTEGSIIELDKLFGEPLELRINGQIVALGEVVAVDNHYGIMLKEVIKSKK